MEDYDLIYSKRLNQYGNNLQERIINIRKKEFEKYYLNRSIYQTKIVYNNEEILCSFQPLSQDKNQELKKLLTSREYNFNSGDLLTINDQIWMVSYKKDIITSGYNEYVMLKMSHVIQWYDRDNLLHTSPAFFIGLMTEKIYDMLKTYLRGVVYNESNKFAHLILPKQNKLLRADYLEIDGEGYTVTGFDNSSTLGVSYVTLNNTHLRDNSTKVLDYIEEKNGDLKW